MHRILQFSIAPALTSIGRYLDSGDPTATGPSHPGDFVEPSAIESLTAGGPCDDGVRFHLECELPRLSIRHQVRVARCFISRHGRFIRELQAAQPFHIDVSFPAWRD